MNKEVLMYSIDEIYARLNNIRIDVGNGDYDAVIEETTAIEAVLNRLRRTEGRK